MSANSNNRPIAGIAMCVFGLFLCGLQDIIIKLFSDTYSLLQLIFIRSMVALVPIIIAIALTGGWRSLRSENPKLLWLRGVMVFLSTLSYYMAIASLPLVEVVILVFSVPILVTVMSATLFKERVGLRRWSALAIGFGAILLVVGMGSDFKHLATLFALFSAFTYACAILIMRFMGANEHPWTITLYSACVFIIGGGVASALVLGFGVTVGWENPSLQFLLRPWILPTLGDGLLMVFLGLNSALLFYALIKAYWIAPVSVVAPFEYTYIIWAVIFGYSIWGEVPQITSAIGVTLLIASSFYIFRRELHLSKVAELASPVLAPAPSMVPSSTNPAIPPITSGALGDRAERT